MSIMTNIEENQNYSILNSEKRVRDYNPRNIEFDAKLARKTKDWCKDYNERNINTGNKAIIAYNISPYYLNEKERYIIRVLFFIGLFNGISLGDFIPLYSKIIKEVITDYINVIRGLILKGILTPNNHYSNELSFSKSYRINQPRFVQQDITDKVIIERHYKQQKKFIPRKKYIKFLEENLKKVEIDVELAYEIIEDLDYDLLTDKSPYYFKKGKLIIRRPMTALELKEVYKKVVILIKNKEKELFYKDDYGNTDRIFTAITCMKRELRKALRYNGESLVELDCANSQPLLLNILIQKVFNNYRTFHLFLSFINKPFSYSKKTLSETVSVLSNLVVFNIINRVSISYNSIICARNKINSIINNNLGEEKNEIQRYKDLTESGMFYNDLMEKENIEDRVKFKQKFFQEVLFGKITKRKKKSRKIFEKHFPVLALIVDFYKRNDYCQLAIKLQRVEAEIFIHTIVKRIYKEKPESFILTVHDSIITSKDKEKYVEKVIRESYKKYGLNPKIKISK